MPKLTKVLQKGRLSDLVNRETVSPYLSSIIYQEFSGGKKINQKKMIVYSKNHI